MTFAITMLTLLLLVQLAAEALSCSDRTSYCAAGERERYRGRLFDPEGRPLPARFWLGIASLHEANERTGRLRTREFEADAQGRFCLDLHGEPLPVLVRATSSFSVLPVDPRFRTPTGRAALEDVRAAAARLRIVDPQPFGVTPARAPRLQVVGPAGFSTEPRNPSELWREAADATGKCERPERLAPWYRYEDLSWSWQAHLLHFLPIVGMAVLFAVRRGLVGLALVGAQVALMIALWDPF